MAVPGRHQRIGPDYGTLVLKTSRQGFAGRMGHDLTIEVTRWTGEVFIAEDDLAASTVTVTAEMGSLRVVEGEGGAVPLTEGDKREIAQTAGNLLDAERHPEARFVSTGITVTGPEEGVIDGTLSVRGVERPFRLEVTRTELGRHRATGTVVQSEYGVKPYSAFFGALRLADPVGVEVELDLE
ncbi:YceI family protein [Planotetraspora kaengkrachanensis]|uniref:Polyisoprenoid-binding protein n=1 Tax=Planotetraspora kaengkrachanensis TaxID=575193 RepID=A0A8J3PX30_9ACTN|nr:YceI family protein [Planotetraspora kaengkrachanensis]GIG82712.1 polyisoprenoid-binding protein [Planotetraspora kaengkrachanensis]